MRSINSPHSVEAEDSSTSQRIQSPLSHPRYILSSRLRLNLPRGFFPSDFPTETCAQEFSWAGVVRPRRAVEVERAAKCFEWNFECAQQILNLGPNERKFNKKL
jgi:hypothetical protein